MLRLPEKCRRLTFPLMYKFVKVCLCLSAVVCSLSGQSQSTEAEAAQISPVKPLYLYSHFRDDDLGHLRLSYSTNAGNWQEVNPHGSVSASAMRDPSVMYDPDSA